MAVRRRVLAGYWVWVALLTLAYYTVPAGRVVLWGTLGASAAAAVAVGVAINRPRRKTPWVLVSLAVLAFTAGDVWYLVLTDVLHRVNPSPSVADVFYLLTYPLLVAGLLLLPRTSTLRDRSGVLDVLVVAAGIGLMAWFFLVSPYLEARDLSTLQRLTPIAFPVFDLFFLVAAAGLVTTASRSVSVDLMAVGGIALVAADAVHAVYELQGTWSMGGPADLGWIIFYATWAAAALHPSMALLTEPRILEGEREPTVGREPPATALRLGILTCAALIPPVALLVQAGQGRGVDVVPAIACGLVVLLLLLRVSTALRSNWHATVRERTLRRAGAALMMASDVDAVRGVVLDTADQLFGRSARDASILWLDAETTPGLAIPQTADGALLERGRARFIHTDEVSDAVGGDLSSLRRHELALVVPMIGEADGPSLFGVLIVAADDQRLAELRTALDILGTRAALAIDRIKLTAEAARRESELYFRTLVQSAQDVILIVDASGCIGYASPSASTVFGKPSLAGDYLADLVVPQQRDLVRSTVARFMSGETAPTTAYWSTERPDGSVVELEASFRDLRSDATVRGVVITARDVTEQRRMDQQLRHLAFHDALTGLANRLKFADMVRHAVEGSRANGGTVGVLLVDIDDFNVVNTTMGHAIGDDLLRLVGRRLSEDIARDHTVARLGGDEFAILVEDAADPSDVELIAQRAIETLAEPASIGGSQVSMNASIGVATTVEAANPEDILREADLALYAAKEAGKGRWRRYVADLHAAIARRMELRRALDRAVRQREFAMVYQPIVRLSDGMPVGLEALVRWNDPALGPVPPSEFIEIAEAGGLIVAIGDWALERSLADAREWPPLGDGSPYVSVNVSARQFRTPDFFDMLAKMLTRAGMPSRRVQLEITESLLLRDDERVWTDLGRLRDSGFRVAIDDFGTGYSSLSYLREAAVDVMKIDKSFIDDVTSSSQQRSLVETIIRLARTLGLRTVAEGIEQQNQRDLLLDLGCEFGQGYLFAQPMGQPDTIRWLAKFQKPDESG